MDILITVSKGRADPADTKLDDLVRKQNFKQALADTEKRLKKTKTDRLIVNKAIVLHKQGNFRQAFSILEQVLPNDGAWKDKDILLTLDKFAHTNFCPEPLAEKIFALWNKALKYLPDDEASVTELFEAKFLGHDYQIAQKVASKRWKTSRDWRLRYILSTHLAAHSSLSRSAENERAMMGTVACRMLGADAESAKNDPDYVKEMAAMSFGNDVDHEHQSRRVNVLCGTRELELLLEVYCRHGKQDEAAEIFKSLRHTVPAGARHGLVKDQMLRLKESGKWEEVWNEGIQYLSWGTSTGPEGLSESDAQSFKAYSNDWQLWSTIADALYKGPKEDRSSKRKQLLELLGTISGNDERHRRLVEMYLTAQDEDEDAKDRLCALCIDYFAFAAKSPSCFGDLKEVAPYLPPPLTLRFLAAARDLVTSKYNPTKGLLSSETDWIVSETNALKQEYYRIISEEHKKTDPTLLHSFIANSLRLHNLTIRFIKEVPGWKAVPGSRLVGDDAAMLAIMGLMHLKKRDDRLPTNLLRVTFLLERLLKNSPHNFEAILFAVRVYLYLGNTRRAIAWFRKLDTKNLQHLSTSWILISRLSTINPVGSEEVLREVHNGIKGIANSYGKTTRAFLKNSAWLPLLQQLDCFEGTDHSIAAWVAWSELTQCSTLLMKPAPPTRTRILPTDCKLDLREHSAFPNYEADGSSLEPLLRPGPYIQADWVISQIQAADMRNLFSAAGHNGSICDIATLWDAKFCRYEARDEPVSSSLTASERGRAINFVMMRELLTLLSWRRSESVDLSLLKSCHAAMVHMWEDTFKVLPTYLKETETLVEQLKSSSIPKHVFDITWETFHDYYILIDVIRSVKAFSYAVWVVQQAQNTWIHEDFENNDSAWFMEHWNTWRKSINDILESVATMERLRVEFLKEPRVVDALMEVISSASDQYGERDAVDAILDKDNKLRSPDLRDHCLDLLAGWRDSFSSMAVVADKCRM